MTITTPAIPATPQTNIFIAAPSNAGGVGQTKLSDDNSPMPRDRFFCNYDYFDSVPLTIHGAPVNRFSPGFEKTFLDQSASIEVRMPFAATISNTISTDGIVADQIILGDLNVTLKALIYSSNTLNVAIGMSVELPTAPDTHITGTDGTEVARIQNESVILSPYIGFVYTPSNRLFAQVWTEWGFDTSGSPVDANPNNTSLKQIGRLRNMPLAEFDAQLGYWLFRSAQSESSIQGIAPFIEFHYNSTLGALDAVETGNFAVGPTSHLDEMNLALGLIAQIGNNFNLTLGIVAP